jgi:hypothetical protein
MNIKFFSSFCSSEHCKEKYENICETYLMNNYGPNKEIYVTDGDDYTHAIIINIAMPQLKHDIPKENIIGIAYEPPHFLNITEDFVNYAKKYISKYYLGKKYDLPEPFVEGYSYMWYIQPLKYIPLKNKIMSIMVSEKKISPNHQYRHQLIYNLLRTQLPIDIYGRGCIFFKDVNDERIKGRFNEIEPYENYDFHIAIENYCLPYYFSEKILNPLLCGTTPIYLGSPNIEYYFPNNVIELTGKIGEDMKLLFDICNYPQKYIKKINVEKIKKTVNLLGNMDKLL